MILLNAFADHLDELSRRTWHNLTEAKRLGMRMGEVTITEANLLSIAQFVALTGLSAELVPTKGDESTTGADFEIWFDVGGTILGYTIQAKVLTVGARTFTYREIGKTDGSGTEQAELLVQHAHSVGAFPFHVLFNGWPAGLLGAPTLPTKWSTEHFGCSAIATPEVLRIRRSWPTQRTRKAEHFLPSSVPWSELFRSSRGKSGTPSGDGYGDPNTDCGRTGIRGTEIDLEALAERARALMGGQYEFGYADQLPHYVSRALDGQPFVGDAGQYLPRFVFLIRQW